MHLYSDNSKPACLLLLLVICCPSLVAAEGELPEVAGHKVDFEKEILPILQKNCLACHNKSDAESDLVLETPQAIIAGGSEGPSVERELALIKVADLALVNFGPAFWMFSVLVVLVVVQDSFMCRYSVWKSLEE